MAYLAPKDVVRERRYCFTCLHGRGRETSIKLCGFTFSYFNLSVTSDFEFSGDARGEGGGGDSTNIWV